MKLTEILTECENHYLRNTCVDYDRGKFIELIAQLKKSDFDRMCQDLSKLLSSSKDLLHEFWNRESDACPLQVEEAEEEENKFKSFIDGRYYSIL
jgi:hypothetical protein